VSDGIISTPVGVNVSILSSGQVYVYVFEIQKSIYSPHQINNTYYMRIDGQKKPAPHAYIEAMFKKISYPNLSGKIEVKKVFYNGGSKRLFIEYQFEISNLTQYQNEKGLTVFIDENGYRKNPNKIRSTLHYGNH